MQSDIITIGKMQLKEGKEIVLFSTDGKVHDIASFVREHSRGLNEQERDIILKSLPTLSNEQFERIQVPLVRTQKYANGKYTFTAKRCGTRSAFIPEINCKLKGCRPEDARFPHWEISEKLEVKTSWLPFGVLDAEGVIREILAYCFMKKFGLPCSGEPVAVIEYAPAGKFMNYCLIIRTLFDARTEEFIDCGGVTTHSLVRITSKPKLAEKFLGNEVGLKSIDKREYIEKKTDLLIAFNFEGGFRGILNSNIGNEIIRDGKLHSICDFDSFAVVKIPDARDEKEQRIFTIRAFVELLKTSLPFIDYLKLETDEQKEIHKKLISYYCDHSSVYKTYLEKFMKKTESLGWMQEKLPGYVEDALASPVAFELMQELIPNSYTFKSFKQDSFYVPHR